MIIKEVELKDLKDLQKVCRETFYETFSHQNTKEDMEKYLEMNFSEEILKNEIENKDSKIFIAKDGDKALGYLKINREKAQTEKGYDGSLEIQRIYILLGSKGKGIGLKFIDIAEKIAKKWKLDYIWLGVWEKNQAAIKFYEKRGFIQFDEHIFVLGDDKQRDLLMKKIL